jgi:Mrp family chromosome partitioning ATPase
MPVEALQVGQLSRSSEVLGTLYELLMQKEEEAEVSKAAAIEDTRIISPAELPDGASTPKPTITILTGLFTGIFLGLVLIVIQRTFSGCYRTDHDIRRQMALPAYGIIPLRPRKDLKTGVFSAAVTNPFVESFRLLRRNLYGLKADAASQTVLIASAAMGDGRSMLAANIAKALADDGKTVLLVDADLHRGELSMALGHGGVTALAGLAEWIAGLGRPEMHRVEGQKFLLLASGRLPSNPADFINAPRFGEIMAELRAEFECIILDSPAFPIVSDALALMRHADLVLSVVRINHTKRAAFLAHCELFAGPDIRHGMLINGAAQPGFNAAGVYGGGRWSGTPMRRLLGALASFRRKPAIPER